MFLKALYYSRSCRSVGTKTCLSEYPKNPLTCDCVLEMWRLAGIRDVEIGGVLEMWRFYIQYQSEKHRTRLIPVKQVQRSTILGSNGCGTCMFYYLHVVILCRYLLRRNVMSETMVTVFVRLLYTVR